MCEVNNMFLFCLQIQNYIGINTGHIERTNRMVDNMHRGIYLTAEGIVRTKTEEIGNCRIIILYII